MSSIAALVVLSQLHDEDTYVMPDDSASTKDNRIEEFQHGTFTEEQRAFGATVSDR